jgi:hypothetical protein
MIPGAACQMNREEYRRYATECLTLAGTLSESQARAALLQMAQVWLRLADEKEDANIRPRAPE